MVNTRDEIGGYLELELPDIKKHYHSGLRINTATNAIKLILASNKPSLVYLPYYICPIVSDLFATIGIECKKYSINQKLEINSEPDLCKEEMILYVNYFSIKNEYTKHLKEKYKKKLIIDNSQAFFASPHYESFCIYSARKFFGVPDGAYLYGLNEAEYDNLPVEESVQRVVHLIGRHDESAEAYYSFYQKNQLSLSEASPRKMSKFSSRVLSSIEYPKKRKVRENNFFFLHTYLSQVNLLPMEENSVKGPMVYPLLVKKKGLKEFLISEKVYIATYWPDIVLPDTTSLENDFINHLVPLPIDQRYSLSHMKRLVFLVESFLK